MARAPAVQVSGLTVEFDARGVSVRVLEDVTFDIREGEIFGIVGESGAGKTTLIRTIVGLVPRGARLAAGNVNLLGHSVFALGEHALSSIRGSQVGVIVQNARSHLNPVLPIGQQIANVYRAHRNCNAREAVDRAVEMLRAVGIPAPEDRMRAYPHELSGGMAQRALIGMALVCEPRVVLADEPSSGLDVTIQDQVLRPVVALIPHVERLHVHASHVLEPAGQEITHEPAADEPATASNKDALRKVEGVRHEFTSEAGVGRW